jgi:hypothetical protein
MRSCCVRMNDDGTNIIVSQQRRDLDFGDWASAQYSCNGESGPATSSCTTCSDVISVRFLNRSCCARLPQRLDQRAICNDTAVPTLGRIELRRVTTASSNLNGCWVYSHCPGFQLGSTLTLKSTRSPTSARTPGALFINQFANPANPQAHETLLVRKSFARCKAASFGVFDPALLPRGIGNR